MTMTSGFALRFVSRNPTTKHVSIVGKKYRQHGTDAICVARVCVEDIHESTAVAATYDDGLSFVQVFGRSAIA